MESDVVGDVDVRTLTRARDLAAAVPRGAQFVR